MSHGDLRIPFWVAANEERLLKPWLATLSVAQRAALYGIYGCPLDNTIPDERGFTERDYWWAFQGYGLYDEVGHLLRVVDTPTTYTPKEYREAWAIFGIRAGKTDRFAATVTAYEAVCGGHEFYGRKGRPVVCFQIAQDLRMARYSLHSIKATLETMAFLKPGTAQSWIRNVTADRLELKNGVHIATTPPTIKSIRGYDAPVAVLDEVAVWDQDSDAANPDYEIYRQVSSRQAQFPNPKIVGISSPWNKGGLIHQRWETGTDGIKLQCMDCREHPKEGCVACERLRQPHQDRVVLQAPTAALNNPLITERWLHAELAKDPKAFERECLARFQDSLSGFLNSALLQGAIDRGVTERAPVPLNFYVAAMDPAFRRDAFGFAICHQEGHQIVIDLIRQWKPQTGQPVDPKAVLDELAALAPAYRLQSIYTDQYQFEALRQLAQDKGMSLEPIRFTATKKASIYGNLQQLVNQQRIRLVDHPEMLTELRSLERRLTQGGVVQVSAPEGQHDDLATVVALAAHAAVWLNPDVAPTLAAEPTVQQLCEQTIQRRRWTLGSDSLQSWD